MTGGEPRLAKVDRKTIAIALCGELVTIQEGRNKHIAEIKTAELIFIFPQESL